MAMAALFSSFVLMIGVFLLPVLLWGRASAEERTALSGETSPPQGEGRGTGEDGLEPAGLSRGEPIRVLLGDGSVASLPLEEYIWGVVAAEMPASFQPEALKAQAVAARTYAARQAQSGRHAGADVCADSACCQAYRPRQELLERWGDKGEEYAQKLAAAVAATQGEVLRYNGNLITAAFHSSSDGATADALQVWGSAQPYLTSVSTPETEKEVPNFREEVAFSPEEFAALWTEKYPQAALEGEPEGWFTKLERTAWGGVGSVTVGGVSVTGGEVRAALGLRSTRFTVTADGEKVRFTTTGYGHGVGMSQYGANVLAAQGQTYRQILAHYYTGTTLEPL